jgi:hypothetical protein
MNLRNYEVKLSSKSGKYQQKACDNYYLLSIETKVRSKEQNDIAHLATHLRKNKGGCCKCSN